MKKIAAAILVLAVAGTAVAIADTHEDRETLMKQNGGALKALSAAAAATPFDPAAAKVPSQTLIDNAAKIPALFAPGTETADGGATPAVWSDPAGFKAAADKLGADAMAAQAATDGPTFAAALKAVQSDCGSCHTTYRTPHKAAPPPPAQ